MVLLWKVLNTVAKQKFTHFVPRDKPAKRPRKHKKSPSKSEKNNNKNKKYKGQGRGWQTSFSILYIGHERNNNKQKEGYNAKNNN